MAVCCMGPKFLTINQSFKIDQDEQHLAYDLGWAWGPLIKCS